MAEKKAAKKSKGKKKDKKWIQSAIKRPGVFTAKAKKKGITTAQLQENVLKDPDKYDEKTQKQARLRQTLVGVSRRRREKAKDKSPDNPQRFNSHFGEK